MSSVLIIVALASMATGCLTGAEAHRPPSMAFDLPESDVLLIEWQECHESKPCMKGAWDGRDFAFGFHDSPSTVVGRLGREPMQLEIDGSNVYSYGNKVVEMIYTDKSGHTLLSVTWNEQDQTLIDVQLVQTE